MTDADSPNAATPRKNPCGSCLYRREVDSGIWAAEEYEKLERYDRELIEQPQAVFYCHQGAGDVCSGWLGHRDPADLLAVRIGIIDGRLDPACAEYQTGVLLFGSGAEAASHGIRDIHDPSASAVTSIRKIVRVRAIAGDPVVLEETSVDARIRQALERKSRYLRSTADKTAGEERDRGDLSS